MINKIILSDRRILIAVGIALALAVYTLIAFVSVKNLKIKNNDLTAQLKEMSVLGKEFSYIKDIVELKEKKIGLTNVNSVVSALEQMLNSMGLKAKVIKPLEKKQVKEFTEEDAVIEIENIDLNNIVNLLYKIENSPVPMKIKSADMKSSFENPNVFTLGLTTSLISK
jgi:hypothetical protein